MSSTVEITCNIDITDPAQPLGLEIWLDQQLIFDQPCVSGPMAWRHEISDDDAEHDLRWVLKNKTAEHTQIDLDGNIVGDVCLTVRDLQFDGIELGHIFVTQSTYSHDFNGTAEPTQETFYGNMGCNGIVSLKFTSPIYLWLLENL